MYFEPNLSDRSLGTFSALWEIDYCRRNALAYYYLGYYVPGSRTMAYKARFRPGEILDVTAGRWRPFDDADHAADAPYQLNARDAQPSH
jgi:arginine-tRNA-protein transferase